MGLSKTFCHFLKSGLGGASFLDNDRLLLCLSGHQQHCQEMDKNYYPRHLDSWINYKTFWSNHYSVVTLLSNASIPTKFDGDRDSY